MFVFGTVMLPSAAWSMDCQGLDCADVVSVATQQGDVTSHNQDTGSGQSLPIGSKRDCGDCCHHAHVINVVHSVTLVDFSCAEQLYGLSDNLKISIIYGLDRPPRSFA